ncbi:hypothetical protein PV08_02955 [Exophiala spinifera]|uniref:Uncharacterized protein n=1 Tax=Exophiala spinifera TaxID=91928 RepID=A0A0D1YTT3_9EURO|nr:uncharacterized protein PV08_02955 [Exophiala spinifera]KIW18666.1 hypothetical protein PV08_02955 [Exophiala spinifera]
MSNLKNIPIPEGHPFLRKRSDGNSRRRRSSSSSRGTTTTSTNSGWRYLVEECNQEWSDKNLGIYMREGDRHLKAILEAKSFTPVKTVLAAQYKEVPAGWKMPPVVQIRESYVRGTINTEGEYMDSEPTIFPPREDGGIDAEALSRQISLPLDINKTEQYRRILFEALKSLVTSPAIPVMPAVPVRRVVVLGCEQEDADSIFRRK